MFQGYRYKTGIDIFLWRVTYIRSTVPLMADNMQENYLLNFTAKRLLLESWAKTAFSYSLYWYLFTRRNV